MKYKLTQHAIDVLSARDIKIEWVEAAIIYPSLHKVVSEVEEHFFKVISEHSNRCLKVVINPLTCKVVTLYFDRNMRKKGCKNED